MADLMSTRTYEDIESLLQPVVAELTSISSHLEGILITLEGRDAEARTSQAERIADALERLAEYFDKPIEL